MFGRTATLPFTSSAVGEKRPEGVGLEASPETQNGEDGVGPAMIWTKAREDVARADHLREARHSAASYLIKAGLNDLGSRKMIRSAPTEDHEDDLGAS